MALTGRLAAAFAGSLLMLAGTASAEVTLYSQTLGTTPAAVVNTDPNFPFTNCLAAEGCFAKAGQVDAPPGGNMPAQFMFTFTLSPSQMALIASRTGTGVLTVTAARDLGHKAAAAATDWMDASIDGTPLGAMFRDSIDNCPAGERGADYPATTVCGINYHTDITATEAFRIPQGVFQTAAADGTIQIVLNPTDDVGRVKLFAVRLEYVGPEQIPTLDTRWLIALAMLLGLLGVAGTRYARRGVRSKG